MKHFLYLLRTLEGRHKKGLEKKDSARPRGRERRAREIYVEQKKKVIIFFSFSFLSHRLFPTPTPKGSDFPKT